MQRAVAETLNTTRKNVIVALTVALVFTGVFLACYYFDNKYTAPRPAVVNGAVMLDGDGLQNGGLAFLIEGWELTRGAFLAPGYIGADTTETVYIGQYGGFEALGHPSPHGLATYRIRLQLPETERPYALELPEIFSAYDLYVDGAFVKRMGNPYPDAYKPETGSGSIAVRGAGKMEILFHVADYTHFYSGVTYPPAFGTPDGVARYIAARQILHAGFMAAAVFAGLVFIAAGLLGKFGDRSLTLYGLLCLCFAVTIGAPVVKALGVGGVVFYRAEVFCFCLTLLLVMLIARRIVAGSRKVAAPFFAFGALACVFSQIVPFFLRDNLSLMLAYSTAIGAYKVVAAAFMALCVVTDGKRGGLLSAGITAFGVSLAMDRILPMHEPVYTGWFVEVGCFALIACIGAATLRGVAAAYQESLLSRENERRLEMENAALDRLGRMKTELIATVTHETITPLAVLSGYAELIATELRRKGVDEQTAKDLDNVSEETRRIAALIDALNRHARLREDRFRRVRLALPALIDGAARLYAPIPGRDGATLNVRAPGDLPDVTANAGEITQVLFNLLQNARNHTRNGEIRITAEPAGDFVALAVSDTGDGIPPEILPRAFQRGVSGDANGGGIGLCICKEIVQSHGGEIEIESELGKGTTVRFSLPVWKEEPQDEQTLGTAD